MKLWALKSQPDSQRLSKANKKKTAFQDLNTGHEFVLKALANMTLWSELCLHPMHFDTQRVSIKFANLNDFLSIALADALKLITTNP
ncbi:hypothetical protein PoB_002824400 [Plakobranchus ocellatus]|uniref:Uncharacterized protein n=1 Tax=Plakobranchus ocellatus TaxID=259542 RepID=A0AAV4A672_9GAST|nr:hypothetical protein PoB_002824400 [Plakobranchus ocellatus]